MDYVLSNWKMYPTVDEAGALLGALQTGLLERLDAGHALPQVIVCPPVVALAPLRAVADDRVVHLGAQSCHWEDEGPHTGEISARMLRGLAEYVMVGHSDRRAAGETDEQVARKVAAVVRNGLVPLLFVGEDDRSGDAIEQTERRLRDGLSLVDAAHEEVLVVYEPAWAVGADRAAPGDDVRRAVEHLKAVLAGLGVTEPVVLYGGTVNDDNVEELAAIEVLDGIGATRAGLHPDRFLRIIERVAGPDG